MRPSARDGRRPGGLAVTLAAAVLVWVSLDVLFRGPLTDLDAGVSELMRWVDVRRWYWLKFCVYALTQFGARGATTGFIVPFVLFVAWRHRTLRPLFRLAVLVVLVTSTIYSLKYAFGRTAPTIDLLHTAAGRSFPSGHAANSVLVFGLAAWLAADYGMPARIRRGLGVLRWLGPLLTVVSMLLLDYHWFTDMVGGAAAGVLLLRVLYEVDRVGQRYWPDAGGANGRGDGRGAGLATGGARAGRIGPSPGGS